MNTLVTKRTTSPLGLKDLFGWVHKVILTIIVVLVVSACASTLERPTRDIVIVFNSFEYSGVEDDELVFYVKGWLKNPNEFSVRPLRFTYQISLFGKHFTRGIINVSGVDEQIGLNLNLDPRKIDIKKQNAKLYFKSNSRFRFPVRIKFDELGGFAAALQRDVIPYAINLVFTDERGKRAVHKEEGIINLSAILKPVEFRDVEITSSPTGSNISVALFNDNDFDIEVSLCSYQLTTRNSNSNNILSEGRIVIEGGSWELLRANDAIKLSSGTSYSFEAGCSINETRFTNILVGVVE